MSAAILTKTTLGIGLLMALGLIPATPSPRPHIVPPIHLQMHLGPQQIECRVTLYAETFKAWWKDDLKNLAKLSPEARKALDERILKSLRSWLPLKVNGLLVPPVIKNLGYLPPDEGTNFIAIADLGLVYPVKAMPDRMELSWADWQILEDEAIFKVPLVLSVEGDDELITHFLTKEEQGYAWQAPAKDLSSALLGRAIPKAPPQGLPVPWSSLGLLAAALLTAVSSVLRLLPRPLGWKLIVAFLALGAILWPLAPIGHAHIKAPWVKPIELPNEIEANTIFAALQRNIYRAFDYDEEGEIYDVLAESVDGPLLDSLYKEIYESLVMREQEGARAKVSSVKILSSEVSYPDPNQARFDVHCRWRVQGRVEHWGHTHLRTNEYTATYGVLRTEGRWRIASLQLEDQTRKGADVGVFKR